MYKQILGYIGRYIELNEDETALFKSLSRHKKLRKGQLVVEKDLNIICWFLEWQALC